MVVVVYIVGIAVSFNLISYYYFCNYVVVVVVVVVAAAAAAAAKLGQRGSRRGHVTYF